MPSNFTENYGLSQWERTDKVQMEDFNEDNAKLDAALKAGADARAALQTALNAKGNCRIVCQTYTGNGAATKTLTFPGKPLIVFIGDSGAGFLVLVSGTRLGDPNFYGSHLSEVAWSGSSVSVTRVSSTGSNMNSDGIRYTAIALIAAD